MQINFQNTLTGKRVIEVLRDALDDRFATSQYAEAAPRPTYTAEILDSEHESSLRIAFGEGGMIFVDPDDSYGMLWLLCEEESEFPQEDLERVSRILSAAFRSA